MRLRDQFDLTKEPYKTLIEKYRVNVFNKTDPFYEDRCFVFRWNETDIPLNSRRTKIFPNASLTCGLNCDFISAGSDGYMECDCKNPPKCISSAIVQDITSTLMDALSTSNFEIIKCNV